MRAYEKIVPLRWGDMDAMKHLNNTLYFRLMEEVRICWFAEFDLLVMPDGEGPILAHASCDFKKPLTYPGDARVMQSITRLGKASLDAEMIIERTDEPGVVYAQGKNVLVWMNYVTGKSSPWPQHLRSALEAGGVGPQPVKGAA